MSDDAGIPLDRALDSTMRGEFLELERYCSAHPGDYARRRRLVQLFVALDLPESLPGSSLTLRVEDRPPSVAVLTPYFREPLAQIERCHRSVMRQTIRCEHILVADGFPRAEIDAWRATHLRLATSSGNFGDTPRHLAAEAAIEAGFGGIVYLDADNWFRPRHVESLVACHLARRTPLCHSARTLHRADGTMLPLLQRGDNNEHVDGNCLFVASEAFDLPLLWGTWPTELSSIGDRMIWRAAMARGYPHSFTGALTLGYEASHVAFYRAAGEVPPGDARPDLDLEQLFSWHAALPSAERDHLDRRWGFAVSSLLAELRAGAPR
jgi:hypothetical protein